MSEKPILFSTPMVKAILEGRKTKTRRIIKPQPIDSREVDGNFFEGNHKGYVKVDGHPNWQKQFAYEFAKWQPGDRLWVRETWTRGWLWDGEGEHPKDRIPREPMQYLFRASDDFDSIDENGDDLKWKPSIHMPKHAARIWLEVESVGVERLQEISEEDAIAEGIEFQEWEWGPIAFPTLNYPDDEDVTIDRSMVGVKTKAFKDYMVKEHWHLGGAVKSYSTLWQSINGPESWEQNPFVWAITFKRIEP